MLFHVVEIEKADYHELSSLFSLLRKAVNAEREKAKEIGAKPISKVTDEERAIYDRHRILSRLQLQVISQISKLSDQVDLGEVFNG